ncbi:MAG: SPFH domain-containing protein [Anaerolineae bacterium]
MARIFDVIEYFDPTGREIVHRIPEHGSGDFRLGSQLIVRESQAAVFFRDGKALDVFGPGLHTLTTANIPLLVRLIGAPFGGETPFKAEVYFVNLREFLDMKWGTKEAITLRDSQLGIVRLRAFGRYSMQVADPQLFVNKIVGTMGLYETSQIEDYLRGMILSWMTDLLGETATTVLDLPQLFNELSAGVKAKLADEFAGLGLALKSFFVESISLPEEVQKMIDRAAGMRAVGDMDSLLKMDMAESLREMAAQPGGGGEATGVGIGAGLGMGAAIAQTLMGSMQQQQRQAEAGSGAAATFPCPNCGTANPVGAKFCSNCGQKLEGTKFCSQCGAPLTPGAKFCSNCGAKVS